MSVRNNPKLSFLLAMNPGLRINLPIGAPFSTVPSLTFIFIDVCIALAFFGLYFWKISNLLSRVSNLRQLAYTQNEKQANMHATCTISKVTNEDLH